MINVLTIKGLKKRFGEKTILDQINITLEGTKALVIFGPSGSGKTTLLRLIAGLEQPDEGEIYIHDQLVSTPRFQLHPHKRNLGFVFQSPALWPHMTVEENIRFGLKEMNKEQELERVQELMEKMEIIHLLGRYPDKLSGGEAKRVALARSLAPRPSILLMDEPLTNLDENVKDQLIHHIKQLTQENNTSLVYVTHDKEEAARISETWFQL